MNRQVRDGLGGLCFAAVAALIGLAVSAAGGADHLGRTLFVIAGLIAVVSLIAIGRGVTADGPS